MRTSKEENLSYNIIPVFFTNGLRIQFNIQRYFFTIYLVTTTN